MVSLEVQELQERAVKELLEKAELSLRGEGKKELTFKAPTGSGKTFMMASFCSRLLSRHKKVVFLISSLSKAKLSLQNFQKFEEYKEKFKDDFSLL